MMIAVGWFRESLQLLAVALGGFLFLGMNVNSQSLPKSDQELTPLIRSVQGPDIYRAYCASCHGVDGKGAGPAEDHAARSHSLSQKPWGTISIDASQKHNKGRGGCCVSWFAGNADMGTCISPN